MANYEYSRHRRREEARRRRIRFLIVLVVLLFIASGAVILIKLRQGVTSEGALLMSFQNENVQVEPDLPEAKGPAPFASSLAVVPDENVYYDTSIATGAAIMVNDTTQEVLHSEGAFIEKSNASTTKLMTLLCVLRYGNLSDAVTVTADALNPLIGTGSTVAGLAEGDTISMDQLLYGLMLPSGNDAANVIAIHMDGSIAAFSDRMNQLAWEIGATHSHFLTPHGLDQEGHYTTAYDLYLILHELLKDPRFTQITGTPIYTATYTNAAGQAVSQTWTNTNAFINGGYSAPDGVTVNGGKTGTDSTAMYCLTCTAIDRNGQQYIGVVLQSWSNDARYSNMKNLLVKIVN